MDKSAIIQRLSEQEGHIGFYCENLITGEIFGYNEDDRFVAASVIKLPIFMCISKWVKEGKADFNEKIKVRNEDKLPIYGALTLFTDEPTVDIRTLCNLMISLSDNSATNLLIRRFGMPAFNEEFKVIGLKDTLLCRLLFDWNPEAIGLSNYIVPSEIGMLLKMIYERHFVDEQTSKDIEDLLFLQHFNHKIPGFIGDGTVPIAHKTGEGRGTSHDVGLVYAGQPFVICFTSNKTDVPVFEDVIRKTAYEIFLSYNE